MTVSLHVSLSTEKMKVLEKCIDFVTLHVFVKLGTKTRKHYREVNYCV